MSHLTAMDGQFVHQIPEPMLNDQTHHPFWRERLFFNIHPRSGLGDVLILTLAHFPARRQMDSLQLGCARAHDLPPDRSNPSPAVSAPAH